MFANFFFAFNWFYISLACAPVFLNCWLDEDHNLLKPNAKFRVCFVWAALYFRPTNRFNLTRNELKSSPTISMASILLCKSHWRNVVSVSFFIRMATYSCTVYTHIFLFVTKQVYVCKLLVVKHFWINPHLSQMIYCKEYSKCHCAIDKHRIFTTFGQC